jgi:hypothetical protein
MDLVGLEKLKIAGWRKKPHLLTPLLLAAETHSKGKLTSSKDTLLLPTINHNSVVHLRVA